MEFIREKEIVCPYCGELISILIDCSIRNQSYIEDCHVCCQPILINILITDDNKIHVNSRKENE